MTPFYVITSYQSLLRHHSKLKKGDLILTRLPIRPENFPLLFDLREREVICYPSFLSQILSHSKVAQAEILREFMLPHTRVIRNKGELLQVMQSPPPYEALVTKRDFANCGLGIALWNSLEEVFKFAGTEVLPFPFVLQPFFKDWVDLRVVVLGERYFEAYLRENPRNFRQNLFFGGKARAYELSQEELGFCQRVMQRGGFPVAHLDLAYVEGKGPYLSEINLRGGLKGARISPSYYEELLKELRDDFFKAWQAEHQPFEVL